MYLPDSLPRQPFLGDCWFFLAKLSQLLNGFLTFPEMNRFIVNILELIHFGNTLDNTQGRVIKSRDVSRS